MLGWLRDSTIRDIRYVISDTAHHTAPPLAVEQQEGQGLVYQVEGLAQEVEEVQEVQEALGLRAVGLEAACWVAARWDDKSSQ